MNLKSGKNKWYMDLSKFSMFCSICLLFILLVSVGAELPLC